MKISTKKKGSIKKVMKELKAQERNISWLSRKLGLHRQTLIYWQRQDSVPKWHRGAIADVLGKTTKELFKA